MFSNLSIALLPLIFVHREARAGEPRAPRAAAPPRDAGLERAPHAKGLKRAPRAPCEPGAKRAPPAAGVKRSARAKGQKRAPAKERVEAAPFVAVRPDYHALEIADFDRLLGDDSKEGEFCPRGVGGSHKWPMERSVETPTAIHPRSGLTTVTHKGVAYCLQKDACHTDTAGELNVDVCTDCFESLTKGNIPDASLVNIDPGTATTSIIIDGVGHDLPPLTFFEEQLVAPLRAFRHLVTCMGKVALQSVRTLPSMQRMLGIRLSKDMSLQCLARSHKL